MVPYYKKNTSADFGWRKKFVIFQIRIILQNESEKTMFLILFALFWLDGKNRCSQAVTYLRRSGESDGLTLVLLFCIHLVCTSLLVACDLSLGTTMMNWGSHFSGLRLNGVNNRQIWSFVKAKDNDKRLRVLSAILYYNNMDCLLVFMTPAKMQAKKYQAISAHSCRMGGETVSTETRGRLFIRNYLDPSDKDLMYGHNFDHFFQN